MGVGWAESVARNVCTILVEKLEQKRPFGRRWRRLEDNIKIILGKCNTEALNGFIGYSLKESHIVIVDTETTFFC
jgi:methylthioribose-1-phosphate isomerase